jgi:hypothetical protein
MRAALAAAAVCLCAATVAAQPEGQDHAETRARFGLCRAAVFHHLEPGAEARTVPRDVAETLLEQFGFVMFETVAGAGQASIDEQRASLAFVEDFFLQFGAVLAREDARLREVAEREKLLMACQPFVWSLVKPRIDHLLAWRERSIGAPPLPSALAEDLRTLRVDQSP